MASTWTLNNAVEKIADGEKTDTWGQITNRNFDILDRAASGVGTIDLSSSAAAHTLNTANGSTGDALSDGMYKVLVLSGATQNCTITVSPNDASKFYLVDNNSGHDAIFTQGTGANVTVANGSTGVIYCDGTGAAANVRAIIDATTLTALGITATAAELNILDGVTSTTAELNILDGVTATAAELNYNDITTLGTSEASKVVTANSSGDVNLSGNLNILTQGDLRLQDSSGGEYAAIKSPTTISSSYTLSLPTASGTSGQVISTDGSGQLSFTSPSVLGGLSKLATVNASAGSSMVFDGYFSSSYDHYILRFHISTTSAQSSMLLRFRTGGSDLSNNYYYANFGRNTAGTAIANEAATATSLSMFFSHESGVGGGLVGQVLISDPLSTTRMKVANYEITGKTGSYASTTISGGGGNQSTSALSGLTLLVPSGTFDGTATLYGMGK